MTGEFSITSIVPVNNKIILLETDLEENANVTSINQNIEPQVGQIIILENNRQEFGLSECLNEHIILLDNRSLDEHIISLDNRSLDTKSLDDACLNNGLLYNTPHSLPEENKVSDILICSNKFESAIKNLPIEIIDDTIIVEKEVHNSCLNVDNESSQASMYKNS